MNSCSYSWGAGTFTAELLLWCCAMLLWRELDNRQLLSLYFILTQILSGGKAKINLQTKLNLTVFMPISCLMWSGCHLVFFNIVMSSYASLCSNSLNVRNLVNWKCNFKENIIKEYFGERITKEVVIISIEIYFSAFHWGMKYRLN